MQTTHLGVFFYTLSAGHQHKHVHSLLIKYIQHVSNMFSFVISFNQQLRCLVFSVGSSVRRHLQEVSHKLDEGFYASVAWCLQCLWSGRRAFLLSLQKQAQGFTNGIKERCCCQTKTSARRGHTHAHICNKDIQFPAFPYIVCDNRCLLICDLVSVHSQRFQFLEKHGRVQFRLNWTAAQEPYRLVFNYRKCSSHFSFL